MRKIHLLTVIILIILIAVIVALIVCIYKHQKQVRNRNNISEAGANRNDYDAQRDVNDDNEFQFKGH